MKDYSDFPPVKYFMRVLKSSPKSAFLYIQIWMKRGRHMRVSAYKRDIRKDYLMSRTMFRNLLAPLMYFNLIHFVECEDSFQIEVSGQQLNE